MKQFLFGALAVSALIISGSFAWLTVVTAQTERTLPDVVDARAASIQAAVVARLDTHASALEALADRRAHQTLEIVQDAVSRTDSRTLDALAMVDSMAATANAQLNSIHADLARQIGGLSAILSGLAKPVQETAQQIDDAAPLFLDCDHNPDCLFNRYQGVAKATEKMAQDGAQASRTINTELPKMTDHVEHVAQDITREADQLTRPQSFWQGLRTWLLSLARIYGAI